MKNYYVSANKESKQAQKLQQLINLEIKKLEAFGRFGPNPDSFLEKYCDPFFDSFREEEEDHDVTNNELQENFEIAYNYLLYLKKCVGIEEDYANGVF